MVICGDATSLPTLEEEEIVREEEEEEERQKSVFVKDALRAAGGVGSLSLLLLLFVPFFCPPFASVCSGEMEGEEGEYVCAIPDWDRRRGESHLIIGFHFFARRPQRG